ncbi:DoxX family protein [Pseudohongiella acticola]|jgi:putative oxidoreductase|uniref:DoxX family protein n=1 Tax=Pseudohongiella acticola TaxID=1524254 RepID=UPI0030EDF80C
MSIISTVNRCVDSVGNNTQTLSWTLLRVLSSAMFMTHGWPKMFGTQAQPFLGGMGFFGIDVGVNMLWVAGAIELFGGALLLLGLFTRYAALFAAVLMVMAYLTAHPAWFPTLNNGELATLYFLVYFAIFAIGPGKISLDYLIRGRS